MDMFLRSIHRKKDGKDHRYFSIVENHRTASDKTVQRTVLYLGEINDQQQLAWRKTLAVFDEQQQEYTNLSLFPDDREVVCGEDLLTISYDSKALNWIRGAQVRKFG